MTESPEPDASLHRSVDDVTSWPYLDLIDAGRPRSGDDVIIFYVAEIIG
jgi:hypothetical protein